MGRGAHWSSECATRHSSTTALKAIQPNGRSAQDRNAAGGKRLMSKLEHLRPEGLLRNPAFSQVVTASGRRTIYTAGQVSIDARGAPVGAGDLAAQAEQALRNVGLALAAAGASHSDV